MPALTPGSLVLVTGASGFMGTHTVGTLLDAGFAVRAAVRSADKGEHLKAEFPAHAERVSYAIVPDMSEPTAYDAAVVGVDAVVHLASPTDLMTPGPPSVIIQPAIDGVVNVLSAVQRFAPTVQRVVQMSSVGAIATVGKGSVPEPVTYTEADWNTEALEICEKEGAAAGPNFKYSASKIAAEKAFWDFIAERKPHWDGVALIPTYCVGPSNGFSATGGVAGPIAMVVPFLQPGIPDQALANSFDNFIDVRDVALAILKSLTLPQAGGERIILSADTLFGNDFAVVAGTLPNLPTGINKGNADPAYRASLAASSVVYDGHKAERVLGITYRKRDESIKDTFKAIRAKLAI
ncbi:Putative uncharacterized oxidoreductase [Vanrija pseudolonga]|uniref:Uncharacterized oxidoreductase n=1 Tax=Vanrija pseudolonga TaxID=143232 RepID=A0AAF1BNH2_9TREE|nr:Putative uncharacterized oxidoreductase [Vanrija pseudolonga]